MANPTKVIFTLPTTNVDGTALAAADVTGIKYVISGAGDASATVAHADLGLDASGNGSFSLPALSPGKYDIVLVTESVSQGQAVESAASNPVAFEIVAVPSIPNPPLAVSVV